ncbi:MULTISPECIES: hypothetical protein [Streptomyces]|uniref:hypothetical protein n=1 Tax=Streptomyces lycopersici TaxID=2974589 RepID=UPI0021D30AC6|nr:hypothetical protein [Streptomyces sp. NEAU-383]
MTDTSPTDDLLDKNDRSTGQKYPSQIAVFCDTCGIQQTGDYIVSDTMTRDERLGVARRNLAVNEGWQCDETGDFCPDHKPEEAQEEAAGCEKCKKPFDPTDARFNGRAQYNFSPYCRRCVDHCHESTDAFHVCVICR